MTSVERPSSGRDAVDAARDDLRGLFELETLHRRGPAYLVWVGWQGPNALDATHRLGVVHAGLTPANVLIDAAGDARVTDFWVPWVLEQLGAFAADTDMTRKLAYRAPEQIAEGLAGPEADQYALAALMQACLSGKLARETGGGVPPRVTRALERARRPGPGDPVARRGEFA